MRKYICFFFLIAAVSVFSQNDSMAKFSAESRSKLEWNVSTRSQVLFKALVKVDSSFNKDICEELGVNVISVFSNDIIGVEASEDALYRLAEHDMVYRIEVSRNSNVSTDTARESGHVSEVHDGETLPYGFTGKNVVVGIIDSGFDVNHPAFKNDKGELRVERFWNQMSGRLLVSPDEIIKEGTDNDTQYHGTHVANIAAGSYFGKVDNSSSTTIERNPYYGVAYDSKLVLVGSTLEDVDILNGIKYVFDYADTLGLPAVVNISLNYPYGPHDGTSLFDKAVDAMVGPGKILVGASGNDAKLRTHASIDLSSEKSSGMTCFVPSAYEKNTIEVWGNAPDMSVKIDITDDSGVSLWNCQVQKNDGVFSVPENLNHTSDASISFKTELYNNVRRMYHVSLNKINLKGYILRITVSGEPQHVDLWSDQNSGKFSNQGFSDCVDYDNSSTIGELGGTGKRIISVGNYTTRNKWINYSGKQQSMTLEYPLGKINYTSSMGPTPDGRIKPDVSAPGTMILSAVSSYSDYYKENGAKTAAKYSVDGKDYFWGELTGTSQASPFVAGVVALWLEANPNLTPEGVLDIIRKTSVKDTYTGDVPNNTYGYGKINALEGIKSILFGSMTKEISCAGHYGVMLSDRFRFKEDGTAYIKLISVDGKIYYSGITSFKTGDVLCFDNYMLSEGIYILNIGNEVYKFIWN